MELKMAVATLVSRLHVTADLERMTARTVADLVKQTTSMITLHLSGPAWLRMASRVAAGPTAVEDVGGGALTGPVAQAVQSAMQAE
jgi:hypothetical protein